MGKEENNNKIKLIIELKKDILLLDQDLCKYILVDLQLDFSQDY